MNNRILELIKYKTGGKQKVFAEIMGWSPQYVTKMIRGENIGLQPLLTILEKLPEIDARWLLLGKGSMLSEDKVMELRRESYSRLQSIIMLDRFIPVMTSSEIKRFEEALSGNSYPDFSDEEISNWEFRLAQKNKTIEERINDAMSKAM